VGALTNGFALRLLDSTDQTFVVVFSVASPLHPQLTEPNGTGIGFVTFEGVHNRNIWAEKVVIVFVLGLL
jgi:hypothetical protein